MATYEYPLVLDTISNKEIDSLCDWLKTYPRLTKGEKTIQFEKEWSNYLNTNHSVYVNSGSSAIILMLSALMVNGTLKRGDKVVVPSIAWATDLSSVIQLGLEPVLCDCNLEDLSVDLQEFKQIIIEHQPKVLLLVSVLGLVPCMSDLQEICAENNIVLLEDACESLGSKHLDKYLGCFGEMSCFSLYYGHHISTIEGGMISTDSLEYIRILKSIRNHGWDRDWSDSYKEEMRKKFKVSNFDSLYTFYYPGFNMRATDLQAFIGISQLETVQDVAVKRERNFRFYLKHMPENFWKPVYRDGDFISNFAYPVIAENRESIVNALLENGVECRPLICGSMGKQPMYTNLYGAKSFTNSEKVDKNGFYVPNNPFMGEEEVINICNIIREAK